MSQSILNSLAGALREAGMNYTDADDPDFYKYLIKAVLERMKESHSLIHHLTTSEERILFIAIINKILEEK